MAEETTTIEPQQIETYEQKPEKRLEIPQAMTVSEAARLLASARGKQEAPSEAAPEQSEAQAEDAQPQKAQSETTEEAETDESPAIEPPKSWKRDEKERFQSLPREMQEYLVERESERDKGLSKSQQEAAEQRKALEVERQRVEQARQQYESALPQLLQTLQLSQMGEFGDIKTIADVEKLAREDWPRYLQWDVAQKKIAAVQQEMLVAEQRKHQDKADKFRDFASREDAAFAEQVPEVKDPKKFGELQKGAEQLLKDIGFSNDELGEGWMGARDFSLRDHRVQLLIRDAYLYREGQKAVKNIAAKKAPAPKVQRPGTAQPQNAAQVSRIRQLEEQLGQSRGLAATRIATELYQARKALSQ